MCKRYVCTPKASAPSDQVGDTFCMNEETTLKELYKVYTYYDMCPCKVFLAPS